MSASTSTGQEAVAATAAPKIGFVSLGCPKALTDSELILTQLRAEGYEVISLSGGEPLLYPWLPQLLAAAKAEGFRTAAITNGFRVTPQHRELIETLDRIAISFDGLEARHNAMRGNSQAWARAVSGLRYLAEIGKPAAAAFTVTNGSLASSRPLDAPGPVRLAVIRALPPSTLP